MSVKNYSKLLIRRYRLYLSRFIVAIVCVCLFLQIKCGAFPLISNNTLENVFIRANILLHQSSLDCTGDPLQKWCQNEVKLCDPYLIVYDDLFVVAYSAILQPKLAEGKRIGGENVKNVLHQPEQDEYFSFKNDFIRLPCYIPELGEKLPDDYLDSVFSSATLYQSHTDVEIVNEITIAVRRQDYVNFYHTITDLYTIYLLCRFFRQDPKSVRILFLDAHPAANLDLFWSQLFHSYTRLGQLKNSSSILYRQLIWAQPQPTSEIDINQNHREAPSYLFDFRDHFRKQFDIEYQTNPNVSCQSVKIFFLVRHNYVAHPRNPSGIIDRQLSNENQILKDLKVKFSEHPNVNFSWNHFEELSIVEQLKIIVETDIFVGIHGAGLTHVLFLKPNRVLIELVDAPIKVSHFELLASMNKINYQRCLIDNSPSTATKTIYDCITKELFQLCPSIT